MMERSAYGSWMPAALSSGGSLNAIGVTLTLLIFIWDHSSRREGTHEIRGQAIDLVVDRRRNDRCGVGTAELSQQTDPLHRAIRRGRLHRPARAHRRAASAGRLG